MTSHIWMVHTTHENESCRRDGWIFSQERVAVLTAFYCNTLQHTATYCNTLQHTATHCNTLQHTATYWMKFFTQKGRNTWRNQERRAHALYSSHACKCFMPHGWNNLARLLGYRITPQQSHPRRCKTSLVGQSVGLSVPRSPVRFRQKLQKSRTQIYIWAHRASSKATKLCLTK